MARSRRLAAALMLAIGLSWLGGSIAIAADPSTNSSICALLPADAASLAARLGCALGQAPGQVASAANPIEQAAAGSAEAALTSWLDGGAGWMVQGIMSLVLGGSTTPSLDPTQAASFAQVYGRVVGVALSLSVLLVLIGIIEAALTRRPDGMRRVVTGIAVSGIGLGAVPAATAILVRIVDDLSAYVIGSQSQATAGGMDKIMVILQVPNPLEGPGAAYALAALGVMLGGALLWLELAVRGSLIYLFMAVVPLACAAVQWPRLEGVLRQVLFAGLALIVSKLVIAICLVVGFALLSSGKGLEELFSGMFILLIAALMPFATARVLPLAAEEMSLSHQGRVRRTVMTGVGTSLRVAQMAAGSLSLSASTGASSTRTPSATSSASHLTRATSRTEATGGTRPAGGGREAGAAAPTPSTRTAAPAGEPTPPRKERTRRRRPSGPTPPVE